MDMTYQAEDRHLTVFLSGELDHHAARGVMLSMEKCMEQTLPVRTVLDLKALTFMDSSGIAVVLRAARRMEALGGTLAVVNIPRQAAKVLEAAGLGRRVDLMREADR